MKTRIGCFLYYCAFLLMVMVLPARAGLDEGLLVYLPLSRDISDVSTNKQFVDYEGKVVIRDGAAYFSGDGDWLELPPQPLHHPFTISMWIKATGTNDTAGLVEQRDSQTGGHHLHLMLRYGLKPYLGFFMNDAASLVSVQRGEWAHLVFQHTGTNQEIWLNGKMIKQRKSQPFWGKTGLMRIGRNPRWKNVPTDDFEGYMREFRVYGRVLSPEEIGTLTSLGSIPGK